MTPLGNKTLVLYDLDKLIKHQNQCRYQEIVKKLKSRFDYIGSKPSHKVNQSLVKKQLTNLLELRGVVKFFQNEIPLADQIDRNMVTQLNQLIERINKEITLLW